MILLLLLAATRLFSVYSKGSYVEMPYGITLYWTFSGSKVHFTLKHPYELKHKYDYLAIGFYPKTGYATVKDVFLFYLDTQEAEDRFMYLIPNAYPLKDYSEGGKSNIESYSKDKFIVLSRPVHTGDYYDISFYGERRYELWWGLGIRGALDVEQPREEGKLEIELESSGKKCYPKIVSKCK
mmetsp:Transcript_16064/g.23249  ORF Transcript_16064/g.23249 Transcript_16064/m.23249 type:complete len:182 (-) Transcript_16064:23-568(-)